MTLDHSEITKLHETIAAQASEIESLRISYDAACMLAAQMHEAVMGEVIGPYHGVVEDVRTKVAAQAAVIEKLREALSVVMWFVPNHPTVPENKRRFDILKEALAIPTNSTQILDEVRRAERERVAQMILNGRFLHDESPAALFAKEVATAIRAME